MSARASRIPLMGIALLALLLGASPRRAWGADPQPYAVHFASTDNAALNALLKSSSQLDSLRKSAPVGAFALVDRAQQDVPRLQSALQSYGYYRSQTIISVEGHALADAGLPGLLADLPKGMTAKIEVRFVLGPIYHLRQISVTGSVSAGARAALKLKSGQPAVAQDVLDARQRLLTQLEEEGHAYASVDEPIATLQDAEQALDVSFNADPGPVYTLGSIRFEGLMHLRESFLRRQLKIHAGDPYRASELEQARETLLNLGVFATVSVRLPPREQLSGAALPVTFVLTERKRHAVNLNGEYSSDLGIVAGVGWTDRNVLGRGDQLTVNTSLYGLGGNGTATNGVSYDASAQLTLPDFFAPTQSLQLQLQFLKPELTAYTQIAAIGGVTLSRKLSSVWNLSAGLTLEEERIKQNEVVSCERAALPNEKLGPGAVDYCHYTLLSFPLMARYDSTDLNNPLLDPTHGFRAQLLLTPTETLYGPHANFLITQVNASTYFDLSHLGWTQPGRSVFALRGLVGQAAGAGEFGLPADLRFYAGGSATVRGYAYQGLGPYFPGPETAGQYPMGGTGITAGSVEFRQRVWGNFGFALFVDGGEVTAPGQVESGRYHYGYGGGPRYYTPIGPIRLDVGLPLNREAGGDAFEAYIGIGQAF